MARKPKRAKARRDRRQPPPHAGGGPSRPIEETAEDDLQAPAPLEHSSGEVELAEAQLAAAAPEPTDDRLAEEAFREEEDSADGVARAPVARARETEGNRVVAFARGSWRELQRVQWPDRRQVAQATGVVLGFVVIAGAFLGLADLVAGKLVDAIL